MQKGRSPFLPRVLHKRGLRPGDAVALIEAAEGFLVYQGGVDPQTLAWWQALSEEDQRHAVAEARRYGSPQLTPNVTLWNEGRGRPWRPTLRTTSVSCQPRSVLLDKGVIRRVYERRVRFALGVPQPPAHVEAANAYAQLCIPAQRLYITAQTAHILDRRPAALCRAFPD